MSDTATETLPELVSRVVDDAKEVARAEVALIKAQTVAKLAGYRAAAIFLSVAALMGTAAFIALVLGLLLMLSVAIGPGWATLIVVGGATLLAGLLGWLGIQRIKRA